MNRAPEGLLRRLLAATEVGKGKPVRAALSSIETDATFAIGSHLGENPAERYAPDREEILRQALEAWRVNPLARRIVGLTSQYVVGGGISFSCAHEPTAAFLRDLWEHPRAGTGMQFHLHPEWGNTHATLPRQYHSGGR